MEPDYYPAFKGAKFDILWDIDFWTTNTGASLRHCGIEPALPREEIVRRKEEFLKHHPEWAGIQAKEIGPNGEMIPPNNTKKAT
jgi:hypothetical protein